MNNCTSSLKNTKCIYALLCCTMLFALVSILAACDKSAQDPASDDTTQPWQEAYAAVLRDYAILHGENEIGYSDEEKSFLLYDIDEDGIPELIVRNRFSYTITYFAAYTFADNQLIKLDSEYYHAQAMFFPRPDNKPGIGMAVMTGLWESVALLIIENQSLIPEIVLETGEEEGISDSQWWAIDGTDITRKEVSPDEWNTALESNFGQWDGWGSIILFPISETNIYEIVLRWSE